MDFELSDEQTALLDSTRRVIAADAPIATSRELVESGTAYSTDLWKHGTELGWPAIAVPEDNGGLGQGLVDLALITIELGREAAPSPLSPTAIVADALARSSSVALRDELLPPLLGGSTAAWAFQERGGAFSAHSLRTEATRHGDTFRLTGDKSYVQDAATAGLLLVDALLDGSPARFVVRRDTPGLTINRIQSLDIVRELGDVHLADVEVGRNALLDGGEEAIRRSAHIMSVLSAAEMVGAGEKLLELTIAYAKDRIQFDRPIGSFQAIKHKCANMRMWAQASCAATLYASMALDAGTPDSARAASVAKSYVSTAMCDLAGEALQIHGGAGFTWENDLHVLIRRIRTNALLHGDVRHHRELLCRSLEESGAELTAQNLEVAPS